MSDRVDALEAHRQKRLADQAAARARHRGQAAASRQARAATHAALRAEVAARKRAAAAAKAPKPSLPFLFDEDTPT